jgi:hypothetical protein
MSEIGPKHHVRLYLVVFGKFRGPMPCRAVPEYDLNQGSHWNGVAAQANASWPHGAMRKATYTCGRGLRRDDWRAPGPAAAVTYLQTTFLVKQLK